MPDIAPTIFDNIDTEDYKIHFFSEGVKDKNVLDIGCVHHDPQKLTSGTWLHKAIVKNANSSIGIDIDRAGIAFLQEKGFNVTYGDACNFDLEQRFATITAGDLIEHLANLEGFFLSCKKHLLPDGKLMVSTPNPWHWRRFLNAFLGRSKINAEHTCWFCPITLSQLANRYGFEIEKLEYGSRGKWAKFLPLPNSIRHTGFMAILKRKP